MLEFYNLCMQPVNLPATVLLGLVLVYWLLLIVGVASLEFLDFDFELGTDGDAGGGIAGDILSFLNVGDVPFMFLASFFSLSYWITTICGNYNFNPDGSFLTALILFFPAVLISLLVTKILSQPLVKNFGDTAGNVPQELVGKQAIVSTLELNDRHGEITVEHDGPPIVVNARTSNGQRLHRNDFVTITEFDPRTRIYIVEPLKMEKP